MVEGNDRPDAPAECKLNGASDLTGLRVHAGAHDGPERSNVEVVAAHVAANLLHIVAGRLVWIQIQRLVGLLMPAIENGLSLDVDGVRWLAPGRQLHEVADLPFQAHVGDDPLARLGIDSGEIPGIRVAIGVAVHHIEEEDEVGALGN